MSIVKGRMVVDLTSELDLPKIIAFAEGFLAGKSNTPETMEALSKAITESPYLKIKVESRFVPEGS